MILLLIAAFLFIYLADFPQLIQSKKWYDLIVLSLLFAGAFVLSVLKVTGTEMPHLAREIQSVVQDMLHLNY